VRLKRSVLLGGGLVAACLVVAWMLVGSGSMGPAPVPAARGPEGRSREKPIPRIDLARLDRKDGPTLAGDSDIFRFGAPSAKIVVKEPTLPSPPAPVSVDGAGGEAGDRAITGPVFPSMNVKYIGSVADKRGLKVAVLMTDKKEVLTGRTGDVVANRLKIVSIGLESVDVQDVGSERVRRIPLRAN
jgi:hypothetical protein